MSSFEDRVEWAQGFESTRRWLARLNKRKADGWASPHTLKSYLKPLAAFCSYASMNPDQLVAERDVDLTKGRFERRRAEERLDAWIAVLQKGNRSPASNALSYYAVCSFYKANHMPLVVDIAPSSRPVNKKPTLTRENLKALLEETKNPMYGAIILCQAQSGLGISDLLSRKYGDVRDQLEAGAERLHLHLIRGKVEFYDVEFDTFFGVASTRGLRRYLAEERSDIGTEDFVFPRTSIDSATAVFDAFLGRVSSRAGLGWKVSSHSFRKFFSNSLKTTRLGDPAFNDSLIDYWMGHKLGRVQGAYTAPPVEDQLRLYVLAEPRLDPYMS